MLEGFIRFLFDLRTITVLVILVVGWFIFVCVKIKLSDGRATGNKVIHIPETPTEEFSRQKRLTLSDEDLEELEQLWLRKYGRVPTEEPDTIEMETITTEMDHGQSPEGEQSRTESADKP